MRGIDFFSYLKTAARRQLFDGYCRAELSPAIGTIGVGTPPFLVDGVSLSTAQGTGVIADPNAAGLPCPGYEVVRTETNPLRSARVDAGAIIASAAERINNREVRLVWEVLTDTERAAIETVWDDGRGLFRPFSFTVPGESVARRFVFLEAELRLERRSARDSRVEVGLVDVGAVAD